MDINELNALKAKIEKCKADKAKAEGAIEQIQQMWVKEFGVNSEEELLLLIQKNETQLKDLEEKYQSYLKEIKTVLDGK